MVSAKGCYYRRRRARDLRRPLRPVVLRLGHGRTEITEAVGRQAAQLDYSPAFQFGHPLSFELANRIVELHARRAEPRVLHRLRLGSGRHRAEDGARLLAHQGPGSKTRLIGREKGYHGVNFGGISVGGMVGNRKTSARGSRPTTCPTRSSPNAFSRGMPAQGAELADELLNLIALHDASNIAAVIVEPFSGSAGVVIPPVGYLQRLREICTANNILLIFDEVITGFGRAGAWTGSEAFGVTPDILNIAKQVTNGVQPLGAVVAKQEIYDTFMALAGPTTCWNFRTATPTRPTRWPAPPAWPRWTCWRRKTPSAACAPWRRTSSGRAQPQGREARGRHPQLRPGRRFHHRGPARRAGQAPLPDRDGHAGRRASTCATAATPSSSRRPSSARRPRSTGSSTRWARASTPAREAPRSLLIA
jgi:hypothetical protein